MSLDGSGSGRKPFDPHRVRGSRQGGGLFDSDAADADPTVSVWQLTQMVKSAIHKGLPGDLHVLGELSNVARPTGGHIYFTLKDSRSEVRCVMWRSDARSLRFDMDDGLEVVATGSVDVFAPRGQYQLYVRRMEPRGIGALDLAFRQLKERLGKAGLFDVDRKRAIPRFPRRIAVVTSPTGAAIRDILQTIERRFPKVHVLVFGVRVQGDGAAAEIADAVRRVNLAAAEHGGIDVMIVGRGGGSLEDLWPFNEEQVARAIHASKVPVVSAVGHEVDWTIADFVADLRAATPTAAAEIVVPVLHDLLADLDGGRHRVSSAMARRLEVARSRLAGLERSAWFRDPVGQVRRRHQQIDELSGRLRLGLSHSARRRRSAVQALALRLAQVRPVVQLARRREMVAAVAHRLRWAQGRLHLLNERRVRAAETRLLTASLSNRVEKETIVLKQIARRLHRGMAAMLDTRSRALAALAGRLEAGSHDRLLRRGFTITRRSRDGRLVRKAAEVREGERLLTETADGRIASRVEDVRQGHLFES